MDEQPSQRLTPKRTPGLRPAYALTGLVLGAAIGTFVGLIVGLFISHLGAIQTVAAVGGVIGLTRGSAVSVRVIGDQLKITNPLRRYRIPAEQVAKLVSVPGSSLRLGPALGLLLHEGYVQIPIRALRFPPAGRAADPHSSRASAFGDVARWAQRNEIPFRASTESWNALLREQAGDGAHDPR